MGLDMYAFASPQTPATAVDFSVEDHRALYYWRKHPNLHGWMETLYREKGGSTPDFNCVNLLLTRADLDRLEQAIKGGALPETTGFFFGESTGDEVADDLGFVNRAREAIEAGLTVFYHAWW